MYTQGHSLQPSMECVHLKKSKMKKLFYLTIIVMALFGCNDKSDVRFGKATFVVSNDTTIIVPDPLTAPRYSCSGLLLAHPKLIDVLQKERNVSFRDTIMVDVDSLLKTIPAYNNGTKKSSQSSDSWFWDILKILLLLLVLAGIIWLLREMFSKKPAPGSTAASVTTASAAKSAEQTTKEATPSRSFSASKIESSDYTGIKNVVEQLQKSSGGGTVTLGALTIVIPSTIPEINISADSGGKIENVSINVSSEVNHADMVDMHTGNDNRQYSRGQKQDPK